MSTPSRFIKVKGFAVNVPAPFSVGHVLTEAEANALNGAYASAIRNIAGPVVDALIEDGTSPEVSQIQAEINEIVSDFRFGTRRNRANASTLRAIEKIALRIARDKVKLSLKKRGIDLRKNAEDITNKAKALLASPKYRQGLLDQARVQFESMQEDEDMFDELANGNDSANSPDNVTLAA